MVQQVNDQTPRVQYTATASQTVFAYPFLIFNKADITVEVNGTIQTVDTDYTVSDVGTITGGNVTLSVASTTGDIVTIYRSMALDRDTDYQDGGDFLATDVNRDFNRLWLAIQQVIEKAGRSLEYAVDDIVGTIALPVKASRAGKYLGFDANERAIWLLGRKPLRVPAGGRDGPDPPAARTDAA